LGSFIQIVCGFSLVMLCTCAAADETPSGDSEGLSVSQWQQLEAQSPKLRVQNWPGRVEARRIDGLLWLAKGELESSAVASDFLQRYGDLLGLKPGQLELDGIESTNSRTAVRFQQTLGGLPVLDGAVIVLLDSKRQVRSVVSYARPGLVLEDSGKDVGVTLAGKAAFSRVLGKGAQSRMPKQDGVWKGLVGKAVLASAGKARVVYRVLVPTVPGIEKVVCLVDSATGKVLKVSNEVAK
jgi:hypothetical protein